MIKLNESRQFLIRDYSGHPILCQQIIHDKIITDKIIVEALMSKLFCPKFFCQIISVNSYLDSMINFGGEL